MKFRPCIDIHNGSVKQIVGSVCRIREARLLTILYLNRMQLFMQTNIRKQG